MSGPRVVNEGEVVFRDGQSDGQKIAESVTRFRLLKTQYSLAEADNEAYPVTLYRYTRKSFVKSRAHSEGMSFEHHEVQLRALAAALEAEGAAIHFETVS